MILVKAVRARKEDFANQQKGRLIMKFKWLVSASVMSAITFGNAQGMKMDHMARNMFGGPVYTGAPALEVTASLVSAGGGADHFSIGTALGEMVGPKLTKAELAKLTRQYGGSRVKRFVTVFNFAVDDSLKIATAAGVTLPEPHLTGNALAATLVKAGRDSKGTFWTGYLLDKAVSHKIHVAVMQDIDGKWGMNADRDYHRISNQAHYDLAKALHVPGVRLASLH
jgi:hypothetical protein